MHVHIQDEQGEGIVYLDENGHAVGDGSPLAHFAIHELNHRGVKPEHGEALLKSIVKRLDDATRVGAHLCDEHHGRLSYAQMREMPPEGVSQQASYGTKTAWLTSDDITDEQNVRGPEAYEAIGWDQLTPRERQGVDQLATQNGVTLHAGSDLRTLVRFLNMHRASW